MFKTSFCKIGKNYIKLNVLKTSKNGNAIYLNRRFSAVSSWADKNIVHSSLDEIKFPELTIPEFVFENFSKYPNKIAVECATTGKKYTYEELRKHSKTFGKCLRKKFKLNKGDTIALLLPNIPEFPICLLGALDAGLVVTTVSTNYTPDEVYKQLVDSRSKLVITVAQLWSVVQAALQKFLTSVPTVAIKMLQSETLPTNAVNFQECIETDYDLKEIKDVDYNELAVLCYSSGTTGTSKGVELSTKNIICNILQLQNPSVRYVTSTTDTHQCVVPSILPWFHIYGMAVLLLTNLTSMCKQVSLPKFSPKNYIDMLIKHKPNVLYIVPPIVMLMNSSPLLKRDHLQSISTVCSGGAPLSAKDEDTFLDKAGRDINMVQGYGLTETTGCCIKLSPTKKKLIKTIGSIGVPLGSISIKVVPVDNVFGEALGPNESGELLVKGPTVTKAYYNKPQETKDAFVNGWLKTGDVGYYDFNHHFYITDRIKELIKVKGFQVAPAELESIIREYPGVLNSAIIGVSHTKYGEVPKAFFVQKENANVNIKDLEKFVTSKVADYKRLRGGIVKIDTLPTNASGKILKRELKHMYKQ